MEHLSIVDSQFRRRKKKPAQKAVKLILVFLCLAAIFLVIRLFRSSGSVFDFTFAGLSPGLKTSNDRVNVLLLGNGGGTHDGADLTDSMMLASYNTKTNQAAFISIPRDLWIDSLQGKLNSAYEFGKAKGQGLRFAEQVAGQVLGISIPYAVRLDFSGFTKAIDEVGGVEVDVANTFDDYFYPITGKEDDLCGWTQVEKDFNADEAKTYNVPEGKMLVLEKAGQIATNSADPDVGQQIFTCRYEHIHFNSGLTHMDGATALEFVRSRHGTGIEGSDFARSSRQQKVIEAFRKKLLSLNTLANPAKVSGLVNDFGSSFETDLSVKDALSLYGLTKKMTSTQNIVLSSEGDNPLLTNPPLSDYGGAWVLVPAGGNFDQIHQYIQDVLSGKVRHEASSSARPGTR